MARTTRSPWSGPSSAGSAVPDRTASHTDEQHLPGERENLTDHVNGLGSPVG